MSFLSDNKNKVIVGLIVSLLVVLIALVVVLLGLPGENNDMESYLSEDSSSVIVSSENSIVFDTFSAKEETVTSNVNSNITENSPSSNPNTNTSSNVSSKTEIVSSQNSFLASSSAVSSVPSASDLWDGNITPPTPED